MGGLAVGLPTQVEQGTALVADSGYGEYGDGIVVETDLPGQSAETQYGAILPPTHQILRDCP